MEQLTFAKYAKRRGVSGAAVSKAVKSGRITVKTDPVTGRRWIDPELANREWSQTTDQAKQAGGKELKQRLGHDDSEEDLPQDDANDGPRLGADGKPDPNDPRSYAASRARREFFQAALAKLNFEEREQRLVVAEDVAKEAFRISRLTREAIAAIPDRVAAELAGITDPVKVHTLLTNELTRALEAIANAI